MNDVETHKKHESGRRLSLVRVLVTTVVLGVAVWFAAGQVSKALDNPPTLTKTWFAPYVDTTLTPNYAIEELNQAPAKDMVLGFIVSSTASACTPSWGTYYSLAEASTALDLDRRLTVIRKNGGDVSVSFGGFSNDELAVRCTDVTKLAAAYQSVIDRYAISTIDLDVEGTALTNTAANERRGKALAMIQAAATENEHPLAIWLTLPTAETGMTADGLGVIDATLAAGVNLTGVNLMTMNYGASRTAGQSMSTTVTKSLKAAHTQLDRAYRRAGTNLSSAVLWNKLGATPMIGLNDSLTDTFTPSDAASLVKFAKNQNMGRLSIWSLNRDHPCSSNSDASKVSNICSGVVQDDLAFTETFDVFSGRAATSAKSADVVPPSIAVVKDDPATSPYPIWDASKGYSAARKVVWHGSVYQAKWYTMDDLPDKPVLAEWDTPWTLVGPVLPGEVPAPTTTLKPGTYPAWKAGTVYHKGDRVLLKGVPYEAKWWTKGESPDKDVANEWDSAWTNLAPAPGE